MVSAWNNVLNACSRWKQPAAIFLRGRGRGEGGSPPPPSAEEVETSARHPDQGVPWGGITLAQLARAFWGQGAGTHHFGGALETYVKANMVTFDF